MTIKEYVLEATKDYSAIEGDETHAITFELNLDDQAQVNDAGCNKITFTVVVCLPSNPLGHLRPIKRG